MDKTLIPVRAVRAFWLAEKGRVEAGAIVHVLPLVVPNLLGKIEYVNAADAPRVKAAVGEEDEHNCRNWRASFPPSVGGVFATARGLVSGREL